MRQKRADPGIVQGRFGKELKRAARDALLSLLWERTKTRPMTVVNLLDI